MEETSFGRYRLLDLLGRGGMGEVWRARDTATNRIVAIKLLPPQLAADDTFVARFRREAEAAAQLNNPHIIPIHTYGEIEGRLYVDMRLVDGRDLAEVLADGPLAPQRAVRIIEQVADALHATHEVGLVHRDIKPSNILLAHNDFAYLIDFGIARGADQTAGLTGTGTMIGSWHYMAPERLGAHEADARADIYALACVLYECLTGHRPFPGDTLESQVAGHLTVPPPRPSMTGREVPAAFDAVIAKGMAKEPGQRYQRVTELATAALEAPTVPERSPTARSGPAVEADSPAVPNTDTAEAPRTRRPAGEVLDYPVTPAPRPLPGAPGDSTLIAPPPLLREEQAPEARPGLFARMSRRARIVAGLTVLAVIAAIVATVVIFVTDHTLPFAGLKHPKGVAVDSAGNVYVADEDNHRVLKLAAGNNAQTVLPFADLNQPAGVAVDSAGNTYVADAANNQVLKLAAGSTEQTVLPFTGLRYPAAVAVDSFDNLYVAAGDRVLKLAAGGTAPTVLPFNSLKGSEGVAVDGGGNVYASDRSSHRVLKLAAGASAETVLPFTGLKQPEGVAVDGGGNLYVSDGRNNRVVKLAAGASAQTVLSFSGLFYPWGLAVDSAGNLYVADEGNQRVLKLPADCEWTC